VSKDGTVISGTGSDGGDTFYTPPYRGAMGEVTIKAEAFFVPTTKINAITKRDVNHPSGGLLYTPHVHVPVAGGISNYIPRRITVKWCCRGHHLGKTDVKVAPIPTLR